MSDESDVRREQKRGEDEARKRRQKIEREVREAPHEPDENRPVPSGPLKGNHDANG